MFVCFHVHICARKLENFLLFSYDLTTIRFLHLGKLRQIVCLFAWLTLSDLRRIWHNVHFIVRTVVLVPDVLRYKRYVLCVFLVIDATWGSSDLIENPQLEAVAQALLYLRKHESRCPAKFVGSVSQSRAPMDSLHASLSLIFPSLHLLFCYPSLSLCPLMHLDHCWGLHAKMV